MMRSVTTVVTAAKSRDLTTLATAKEELGITGGAYDKRLRRWIREESAAVERYCGRRLIRETLQEVFIYHHDAGVRGDLRLALWPVDTILSVTWDNVVLTDDQWHLDAEAGLLRRYDGVEGCWAPWFDFPAFYYHPYPSHVVVQYTGGYTVDVDLPPDIEAATLMQLQHRKGAGSRDQTIKSETVPNVLSTTYWIPNPGENAAIIPAAAARLDPHREQRI
jgi:hypothetical protein